MWDSLASSQVLGILFLFCAMTLASGVGRAVEREPIPDRTVVLTFDDAVRSHLDFVAPLLKEHGFQATFFVSHRWLNGEHFLS